MRHTLTAAALMLVACNEADHGHGHQEEAPAAPAPEPAAPAAPAPEAAPAERASAASGPIEGALGTGRARLDPDAEQLRLTLVDAEGAPVPAAGEARVVLTGTGEAAQRVVLKAADGAWVGPAKAAGAPGYVAVISVELGGNTESARLSWGEVPQVEEHGHGDHGHGEEAVRGEHGHDAGHNGDHEDDRDHGHGH